jgi:hypothetical protein
VFHDLDVQGDGVTIHLKKMQVRNKTAKNPEKSDFKGLRVILSGKTGRWK